MSERTSIDLSGNGMRNGHEITNGLMNGLIHENEVPQSLLLIPQKNKIIKA